MAYGQFDSIPARSVLSQGTTGTAAIGTLVGAPGAGSQIWVTSYNIVVSSGTPEICLSYGTATQGSLVITRGAFSQGQGIAQNLMPPDCSNVFNQPLTFQIISGAGTVNWNVNYYSL